MYVSRTDGKMINDAKSYDINHRKPHVSLLIDSFNA